jgi:hypothetical protein
MRWWRLKTAAIAVMDANLEAGLDSVVNEPGCCCMGKELTLKEGEGYYIKAEALRHIR